MSESVPRRWPTGLALASGLVALVLLVLAPRVANSYVVALLINLLLYAVLAIT
jgi:hypothetical protein